MSENLTSDNETVTITKSELRELIREEVLKNWKADCPPPEKPASLTAEDYEVAKWKAAQRERHRYAVEMARHEGAKGGPWNPLWGPEPSYAPIAPPGLLN